MQERAAAASVRGHIEREFGYLVDQFGFVVAQSTENPAFVWFRNDGRTVVVSYDPFDDAAVDVHLEVKATDERHAMADILAFERFDATRRIGVRGDAVAVELARASTLLGEHCVDFLRGDLEAFRLRYREALLVKTTRAAAMHEFYDGDPKRSRVLFEALRAYWTDLDREHVSRLASGAKDKSLAHLRLKH